MILRKNITKKNKKNHMTLRKKNTKKRYDIDISKNTTKKKIKLM